MIQPFQDLIGKTVVRTCADIEMKTVSFALSDGSWQHYGVAVGAHLVHASNVSNLQLGQILGVQAVSGEGDGLVETVVNFDIRDQPEAVLRFEVRGHRAQQAAALGHLLIATEIKEPNGELSPMTEDF